ncbi:Phenoloxidase-activating factor 3 [Amphibalanus amphitrite]|uniref:Phenoloxidase-activating factor 3 n=1 Tax=Amphibalanus amphitrite TaxID=1232801 RepID=A0A6A4VGP1_AMPAM|nr:Phenoloxidase-activating factor 3 [Amphibalanus amphitrite]
MLFRSTIRLGEHDLDNELDCQRLSDGMQRCADPPQNFDIEEVITHDQYDSPIRLRNDIALVRLSRPANLTTFVSPLCLPFGQREEQFVGERPWAVGFGLTSAL